MQTILGRRRLLGGMGAALLVGGLQGCAAVGGRAVGRPAKLTAAQLKFAPILAQTDRITRITVCTRPFRAHGPRLDVEVVGNKTVVHNYGHGGSGWSLSWGSSGVAVAKALATGERNIGVIGCGALGLTSALLLQRAGASVTIYARELPPNVRSSLATGVWTPDSRICLEENASPAFKELWRNMARQSFDTYQSYLGLPGNPVEFIDRYVVSDDPAARRHQPESDSRPAFAELQRELIDDLIPKQVDFEPGSHNLGARYLRRDSSMMFNLSAYTRMLIADFTGNGGKFVITEFHSPADLAPLREKTLIHATGYGARALFGDDSVVPVRGQLARLIPQPDVNYGLFYKDVSFVPRRDGLVFQVVGDSDYYGYNDASTLPDRAEATHAVETIAGLFPNPVAV
jgi:glycine/D-amino acid oxidase-like deaminating enzyme